MQRKYLVLTSVIGGLVLLFIASCLIAGALLGENSEIGSGPGIGLVEVQGAIIDGRDTVKQLREMKKNERVKAVVLRVDSPGGVVGPSQEIHDEVRRLAAEKKVIVSMGSVAASGGYYISAPATMIYANPGTITGSIGVIMKLSNIEELMGKVGLKAFTLKSGRFKDTGSPVRPMSDEDRALLQGVIDNLHGQFVKAVAKGRKLQEEDVRRLADGRIYSGEQALGLKLVDKLGSMQDAVDEAAKLAGVKGEPVIIKPTKKKKLLREMLVEEASGMLSGIVQRQGGFSVNYELDGVDR